MDHSQSPPPHTIGNTRRAASPKTSNLSTPTRSPLSNRANIRVDAVHTNTNWEHKDSSEGQPSSHASVCDAAWLSTSDLTKSPYQTPGRPATPLRSVDIDLESESPLSRLETPFLYGYGTELAPILEQRSIATLRTIGSRSASDLSSLLHDAPGTGSAGGSGSSKSHSKSDTATESRPLRRQNGFGLHDTTTPITHADQRLADSGPRLRCLSYLRPTVHTVDVHAYPRKPIYPPPQRPATPPSIRRIARSRSEADAYVTSASSKIAYEEPGFRPPRSGHGNLSAHPFVSQTTMTTPARSARPRGARGSARAPMRAVPSSRHVAQTSSQHGSSTASAAGTEYPAPPETRGGACQKCGHARGERWSLGSTLVGHGPGMRRGADWCSRCACRKIVRGCCCCRDTESDTGRTRIMREHRGGGAQSNGG
ncbi:hypothetical protein F5B18DRAFT_100694 [Nemania serpens]|nr:hypothetical protein F5B18DRAFT_100694 [Nemania serpens]